MQGKQPNIYAMARSDARISQERAAELLNLSVESVKAYEGGRVVPTNQTVAAMMEAYGVNWLGVKHVQETSRTLRVLPEGLSVRELPSATMQLINRVLQFSDNYRTLLEITEDGVIDEQERPAFDELMDELDEILRAAYELKMSAKKERPEAATSKRSVSRKSETTSTRTIITGSPLIARGFLRKAVAR